MRQAIMANVDKMAIKAVMAWLHMAMMSTDIGVYTKNMKNVDQLWKWDWKFCKKFLSQIVENVHKGGGVKAKIKIVYISNVDFDWWYFEFFRFFPNSNNWNMT